MPILTYYPFIFLKSLGKITNLNLHSRLSRWESTTALELQRNIAGNNLENT
jgi:hypothetical protein